MAAELMEFPLTATTLMAELRYLTDIIAGRNKQETRNAVWQDPLRAYNAAFAVRTYQDIGTLVSFFHACRGREKSFLLTDWQDYRVTDWTEFEETVDGSRTTFQLIKIYENTTVGDYVRQITKPTTVEGAGGVTIRDNGVEVNTSNWSANASTGIVTFSSAPISGHTLDFTIDKFYVPVRFDTDSMPIELLTQWVDASDEDRGLIQIPDIPLIEVRGE